ncbi:sugar transferase [Pontibacterium granulatum]|uniref:sugar transferase n=1 Tax=Pontibacterium granulatum TaxID=2036029 RepID=UPI00249A7483|nr:sugar transferase [Pontibacterium granulatum]MDI3323034.1 sugar transferase [Pontibacterium granulatum]
MNSFLKRVFDLIVAISAAVLLLPVAVMVALFVFCFMGKPIFFTQIRPGIHGKPFKIYKFKTMKDASSDGLVHQSDAERMTRFGRVLRSTSLDEIPQLWNVIRGDMSLVGPRPLLMDYLPLYNDRQMTRHNVKPGITGWAQVNGRNNLSWQEKFEFDIWYVKNQSFCLDLKILWLTVKKVLKRQDVNSKGHATSVRFEGNDK